MAVTGSVVTSSAQVSLRTIPHIVDGGGWKTSISVMNLANLAQRVTVNFWSDQGRSLSLPVVAVGPASSIYFDLPANGLGVLETTGSAAGESTSGVGHDYKHIQCSGLGGVSEADQRPTRFRGCQSNGSEPSAALRAPV